MLSGKVPFQVTGPDKASKIMDRIRGGQFTMEGSEWNIVSETAKQLIAGKSWTISTRNGAAQAIKIFQSD